jgi:hypothetical protein
MSNSLPVEVTMKRLGSTAALLLASMFPSHALPWGGVTTGRIAQLHISAAGNLPLRVYLEGAPVLCVNGMAEGYLDDADPNYKVYAAALMMAKATGATVTLYADVGLYNRCRIGYVVVS